MSVNRNYYPELGHSLRWHHRDMEKLPESCISQKEALFEKSLTPSDVGKLNRLVIPKQHAEKHFPLAGTSGAGGCAGDSSSNSAEKGLVLGFEDESGKSWKFRYSYWNSSQSYVLTKGWSRYVKEKQLDAGDVVFFLRQRSDANRLFIGCRKRTVEATSYLGSQDYGLANTTSFSGGSSGVMGPYHHHQQHYQIHHCHESSYANPLSQPESSLSGGTIPQTPPAAISKTLRLFGVNMECQLDEDHRSPPSTSGGGSGSDHPAGFYNHHHPSPYYMNIGFTGDVNEMGNRRG